MIIAIFTMTMMQSNEQTQLFIRVQRRTRMYKMVMRMMAMVLRTRGESSGVSQRVVGERSVRWV
jgi:hypothetical protein